MDGDLQYLHPVVTSPRYENVRTVGVASLYLSFCQLMALAVCLTAGNWPSHATQCDPFYIAMYIHVAFWFITLITDHYFKWKHHLLYLKGYLKFSEELKKLSALPFYIVSLWTVIYLSIFTLYHQYYIELETACKLKSVKSPVFVLIMLYILEAILIIVIIGRYIYKVILFNGERHTPDVHGSGRLAPLPSFVSDERGFREQEHGYEELLERQADLIKFLKNENEALNKKILSLNCQLRGETIN